MKLYMNTNYLHVIEPGTYGTVLGDYMNDIRDECIDDWLNAMVEHGIAKINEILSEEFIVGSPNISNEQVQEYLDRLNEFYETKMYQLYERVDEETGDIIGEFTPKKNEKIIRIVPISPTEIKTKSIINKEDIETKYGIVTYNPNKPNKKGND